MTTAIHASGESEVPQGIEIFFPAVYDIVWSIVPFLVIMFFFWKFVIPRVNKILDDRATVIEGGIAKAEDAQKEAAAALEQYNIQLTEGRAEAARIREQARAEGAQILADLKEQAAAEAARLTANAHLQIEAERQAALVSLRAEIGTLAIDLASGVIGENLTDDAKSAAMVDRFLADLEASDTTPAPENAGR
ncbi:F0F1 ATP synthase subunit B [Marisediminicola senii]|uniref:F0F1 ATP synthase subunit B n=1 Tax=Marisediminicola senii TaxID=2711233 RepID=UPI0013EDFC0D|nr:F0F1 ATP synthase subunit B [Marisediminicola senii]